MTKVVICNVGQVRHGEKNFRRSSQGVTDQPLLNTTLVCASTSISPALHVQSSAIVLHVTYSCCSVHLRRRCNMLCTSGVTDDVTFANNAIMATKKQREKT